MIDAPASARAQRLLDEAAQHKRLAAHHRRQAQRRMQALERLRTECAALGIHLIVNGEAPEEGPHGRPTRTGP